MNEENKTEKHMAVIDGDSGTAIVQTVAEFAKKKNDIEFAVSALANVFGILAWCAKNNAGKKELEKMMEEVFQKAQAQKQARAEAESAFSA